MADDRQCPVEGKVKKGGCTSLTGRQPLSAAADTPSQKWRKLQDEILVLKGRCSTMTDYPLLPVSSSDRSLHSDWSVRALCSSQPNRDSRLQIWWLLANIQQYLEVSLTDTPLSEQIIWKYSLCHTFVYQEDINDDNKRPIAVKHICAYWLLISTFLSCIISVVVKIAVRLNEQSC